MPKLKTKTAPKKHAKVSDAAPQMPPACCPDESIGAYQQAQSLYRELLEIGCRLERVEYLLDGTTGDHGEGLEPAAEGLLSVLADCQGQAAVVHGFLGRIEHALGVQG